jgi:hypothetical protein
MAKESLPKFDAPPVIETAISVQFSRLLGFSTPMVSAKKLAGCGRSPGNYYVARFSMKELISDYGLSVVPSPVPDSAGHAVIPQLKPNLKTKPLQRRLSEAASQRIVYSPPARHP